MNRSRIVLCSIILLAGVQFLIYSVWICRGLEFVVSRVVLDDTFYYVQTAWNTRIYGFPTFDGLNPTNGVQFLWFWILVALSYIVPTKYELLFLALILCALLNLSSYIAIWWFYRRQSPAVTLIMACSWFYLTARFPYYLTAMENSLHALCFWLLLAQLTAFVEDIHSGGIKAISRFYLITFVSILTVWTRLDSAIYAAPLYLYTAWLLLRSHPLRQKASKAVAAMVPVIILSAGMMFGCYYWMGGSYIPVSGLVKSNYLVINRDLVKWFARSILRGIRLTFPVEAWRLFIPQPDGFFPPVAGVRVIGPLTIGLLALTLLLARRPQVNLVCHHEGARKVTAHFRGLYATLLGANIAYALYYSSAGLHSTYAVWYLSPFLISCILFGARGIERLLMKIPVIHQRMWCVLTVGVLGVLCAGMTAATNYHLLGSSYHGEEQYVRIAVAHWLQEHTPSDSICAAWNAGGLGFLSHRSVINLDGLINSNDYFQSVLAVQKRSHDLYIQRLLEYLERMNVTCVIDNSHTIPQALKDAYVLVKVFPIGDGRSAIEVYQKPWSDR